MPPPPEPASGALPGLITPRWPAPPTVRAVSTTRAGGVSTAPYDSLNLGARCGDDATSVQRNRERLAAALGLAAAPRWLEQVHGASVVDPASVSGEPRADGAVTATPGTACAVLGADCLPLLLCNRAGTRVGAVHAGWRGMAAGVIEAGITHMDTSASELIAWLGPAIGPRAYEVGSEVRDALAADLGDVALATFAPSPRGRWLADLYALARLRLGRAGVASIHGGDRCTLGEPRAFFSHRRDGSTGRMASLVWIDPRQRGPGCAGRA